MRGLLAIAAAGVAAVAAAAATQAQQQQALHSNTHQHSPWHFKKSVPKLTRYRLIAKHDKWVLKTRRSHPAWLNNFHRRELKNALAHIAKLQPVFHYPWWWVPLGVCETGVSPPDPAYGAPGHPGGDGYHGWINFAPSTWDTYKRYVSGASQYTYAYEAPEYVQYLVTMAMHNAGNSWSQSNPACSAKLGM